MKAIIAYALVVVGVPILVGHILGMILVFPVSLIVGLSRRGKETRLEAAEAGSKDLIGWMFREGAGMAVRDRIAHACYDIFSGFGAVLAAGFIFHLFGLSLGVAVLLIVAAWEVFMTVSYRLSFQMLISSLAGMIVGSFVVLRLFPS
jgi:hypothetical protein